MKSKLSRYMINLEQFAAVVDCGSISAASSALAISQPALTRSIKRLEDVLGTRLLYRMPRGVEATDAGKALLQHIAVLAAELDKAETSISVLKGRMTGKVACGAGSVTMNRILPPALGRMREKLKKIQVNLSDGRTVDLLAKLRSGELDIVIGIEQPEAGNSGFLVEPSLHEHFGFFVRSDSRLAKHDTYKMSEIVGQDKLVMPMLAASPVERALESEIQRLGCTLTPHRVETLSPAVFSQLVLNDDYFAFSSSLVFETELRNRSVKWLRGDWHFPPFATCLYRRQGDFPSPMLKSFVDEIRTASKEIEDKQYLELEHA